MKARTKKLLTYGGAALGSLIVISLLAKAASAKTSPPSSQIPPSPSPGAQAKIGDVAVLPVRFLYPTGVPFDPRQGGLFQFGPNDQIDEVWVRITQIDPTGREVAGVTEGFAFSGPSQAGGGQIRERIPTPFFSRGAIIRLNPPRAGI
jgi:hypothetical protein